MAVCLAVRCSCSQPEHGRRTPTVTRRKRTAEEFDLNIRENDNDPAVKIHEIKFDEYGIMDDGLDDSTDVQLARAAKENGAAAALPVQPRSKSTKIIYSMTRTWTT